MISVPLWFIRASHGPLHRYADVFPAMRLGEVDLWPHRHDTRRVDAAVTPIVVLLDVIHVNGFGDARNLVELAGVGPQVWVVGETLDVAGLEFELRDVRQVQGPNFSAIEGVVEIRRDGDFIATVRPQKRQYLVQKNWMTEAGIHPTWNKDLFVALGDQLGDGAWSVRIQYKPMIRFIWIGAFVMALGGFIAISGRRSRRTDK